MQLRLIFANDEPANENLLRLIARSARGNVIAELDRLRDAPQRLQAGARAAHQDVAVAKEAAGDRLVDIDALHLVHVHLNGMAAEEAVLEDDATVGDGDFGRPAVDPRRNAAERAPGEEQ